MSLGEHVDELGRTLGEELLESTAIYVRAITALWEAGIQTRGLAHITGDGYANLVRLEAEVGYELDALPEPQPVFGLIQQLGEIEDEEMFRVFNMGIGMVIITAPSEATRTLSVLESSGQSARRIGTVVGEPGVVRLTQYDLEL